MTQIPPLISLLLPFCLPKLDFSPVYRNIRILDTSFFHDMLIVSELLVEEGEAVKKGQLLVRLDPVKAGATVSRFDNQL